MRAARAIPPLVAALAAGALAGPGAGVAQAPRPELLPDLVPDRALAPVVHRRRDGRRELRFGARVFNRGAGPMETYTTRGNDCDGDGNPRNDRFAKQRVYHDDNGDGRFDRLDDESVTGVLSGCMVFHATHGHWHFEEFAAYRLRSEATGAAVSSSDKVSFCVEDLEALRRPILGQPRESYYDFCGASHPQGISVGWADVYDSSLPGQFVPLRGVSDGVYCLEIATDPSNRLRESNDFNNVARRRVRLRGRSAQPLPGACRAGTQG